MATVDERYAVADAYVRRAVTTVEARGVSYALDPVTGIIEWFAGRTKTEPVRNELARIEARWLRATSDIERARVARDAELLADRVQESLPGAPQDRKRTNLYANEPQTSTPATTYYDEVANQASEVFDGIRHAAGTTVDIAAALGKLLVVGGSVLVGLKVVDYVRERQRRQEVRAAGAERRMLNTGLAHIAAQRDAGAGRPRVYSIRLARSEIKTLYFLGELYESARAIVDGLIPLDDSADRALVGEYDRNEGPYRFQIRARDVRKALRATRGDGGNYGVIPNLRSPAVEFVLSEERSHET